MIKQISIFAVLFSIFLHLTLFAQQQITYMPGEVVIKVEKPFSQINKVDSIVVTDAAWFNSLSKEFNINDLEHVYKSKLDRYKCYYLVRFPADTSVSSVAGKFNNQSMVVWAEPNFIYYPCDTVNDTYWDDQWGPELINCPDAWNITSGKADIIIAVIDIGPDINHEDLQNQLWVNPIEFNGSPNIDDDGNGIIDDIYCYDAVEDDGSISPWHHGTKVAGVCCAQTNNNIGIAGVAGGGFNGETGARLMAINAGNEIMGGVFTAKTVAKAIRYAYDPHGDGSTDDGADVINMSFSGTAVQWWNKHSLIEDAVDTAFTYGRNGKGTVLVSASGNFGDEIEYPGHYQEVIAVGGVEQNGQHWSGTSSYPKEGGGSAPDIWAPGDDGSIISTKHLNRYEYFGKTSAASPHVAGVAALILSLSPNLTSSQVKDILLSTTQNNDIVDASQALLMTLATLNFDISGSICYYSKDEPVSSALIKANDGYSDITDDDGEYEFTDLPGGNYVVRPEKEYDTVPAISAYDATWVLQYGVGLRDFSPYQMIGGDVSGNNAVTAYDAALIRLYYHCS